MDTADTPDKVAPKTRAKKEDPTTPMGDYIRKEAKAQRLKKKTDPVVEKWYELRGDKLSLCKKVKTGTVYRTFLGSRTDTKSGAQIKDFIAKLIKEKRVKVRA